MLTTQGWLVAITSMALVAAGRLFGIFELYLLGAGGAALVIAAAVSVGRTRLRLDVTRELHPPRVHVGGPSRVELKVGNRSGRRSPLLTLRDPVGDGRSASVVVAPLGAGETVRATYRLPTDRRGILRVGPLAVEVTDAFGLASASTRGAPVTELTVWPAIDEIASLPHTTGDDPHGGAEHPNALTAAGEDFYALRAYVLGDDLRHVHWRSTARRDELMVRQDEMPWQGRATVLLDTRADAHTADTFERAVSAAASIVVACSRRRFLLRLVTTGGDDSGSGAGAAHVEQILERLATVSTDRSGHLAGAATALRRAGAAGGALTVLLGGRGEDAEVVARLRRSFAHCTALTFREAPGIGGGAGLHVVDDDHPFPDVWRAALGRRGRAAVAR
jgi:uncharacterized protein (DUF58 family)